MRAVAAFIPPPLAPRDPRFVRPPSELCQLLGTWDGTLPAGEWNAEEKIDGVRAIWADGALWTREGEPLHLPAVIDELRALERRMGPVMLDGEYQAQGGFLATLAAIRRRGCEMAGTMHVFDAVPLSEWRTGTCTTSLVERRAALATAWQGWAPNRLCLSGQRTVRTREDVEQAAQQVWDAGGEGLVLKRADSRYRRRRSADWLKVKREITLTGEVVSIAGRSARVRVEGRRVSVAVTPRQAVRLRPDMPVVLSAMEWTERGQLREGQIVALAA